MAFFREHSRTLAAVLAVNSTKLAVEGEEKQLDTVCHRAISSASSAQRQASEGCSIRYATKLPVRSPVVVLGYGFWQRHFGADPLVVGRTIRLNGKPAIIDGVASHRFQWPEHERAGCGRPSRNSRTSPRAAAC